MRSAAQAQVVDSPFRIPHSQLLTMPNRVLITAFEPFGPWTTNASWLELVELTRDLPSDPQVTTRLYPVDFAKVRDRLKQDLAQNYDVAIHLGQAAGEAGIRMETVGLNIRSPASDGLPTGHSFGTLVDDGPLAYASDLPMALLAERLRSAGIPASVSHHAGTYVCNATLYLARYMVERMAVRTRVGFIHLPLETSQAALDGAKMPSLPASVSAAAIREVLAAVPEIVDGTDGTDETHGSHSSYKSH